MNREDASGERGSGSNLESQREGNEGMTEVMSTFVAEELYMSRCVGCRLDLLLPASLMLLYKLSEGTTSSWDYQMLLHVFRNTRCSVNTLSHLCRHQLLWS